MDMETICRGAASVGTLVCEASPADREEICAMLTVCNAFTQEEVRVALEVLDAGLAGGLEGDYPVFVAKADGEVRGYICVGKTPLTASTWHLYWICVHPTAQGQGVGRLLLEFAETFVGSRSGKRLVLETSEKPSYERSRRFYEAAGYEVVGRIRDFYRRGDPCVLYCKEFGSDGPEQIA
jgi:ribosomal protein S18 acetylase RimI-like enzyme